MVWVGELSSRGHPGARRSTLKRRDHGGCSPTRGFFRDPSSSRMPAGARAPFLCRSAPGTLPSPCRGDDGAPMAPGSQAPRLTHTPSRGEPQGYSVSLTLFSHVDKEQLFMNFFRNVWSWCLVM